MKKLTFRETIFVASMLLGMFFGAGNLIFPVSMGQMAGRNMWQAAAGFLVTGVGLPLLSVAALGISRENGLQGLASRVGKKFGIFFTCALYLTIGPFFATPRCASVSFTVGIERILPANAVSGSGYMLWQAAFSFLFFAVVLFFSLRPGEIMTWIGKVLNPVFLVMLGILVLRALSAPMGTPGDMVPESAYESGAFFTGLLEGYNTMDALAGLAFGIVVIDVIRGLGVKEPGQIARGTVKAGIFSSLLMAVIYLLVTLVGAQSRGQLETAPNGGEALAQIADYYFGGAGMLILAVLVTVACLKTAIGLTTSCSETFCAMFPGGPGYRTWAVGFATLSFLTANLGLDAIIAYAVPVLMFLYPLAIVLVLLTLCGKWFDNDGTVLRWTLGFTGVAAMVDFLRTLPEGTKEFLHISGVTELAETWIPLAGQGLGWVLPAGIGLVIGLLIRRKKQRKAAG